MSYPTVSIGSYPYNVYADQEIADLYEDATISSQGTAWRAAENDTKARALVSATRWLDAATWKGEKTDSDQELMFPRTGLDGVETDELPTQLVSACIELAAYLVEDNDARAVLADASIKEYRAGTVHISYFRPENVQITTVFPQSVMAYVSQWLSGQGSASGAAQSFGTDCKSKLLDDEYDFSHGF